MDEKVAKTPRPHMLDADEVAVTCIVFSDTHARGTRIP